MSRHLSIVAALALLSQACVVEQKEADEAGGSAGAAGGSAGEGGTSAAGESGSGGSDAGSGGSDAGSGGSDAGSGGSDAGSGGSDAGSGGSDAGSGGSDAGSGGSDAGSGGSDAGNGGSGGSDAGASGSGGSDAQGATLAFTGDAAKDIPKGSLYEPLSLSAIPPFSDGVNTVGIHNVGAESVTISGVEIILAEGVLKDELRQSKPGSTAYQPYDITGTELAPDESVSLGLFYWPFESGVRTAKIVIKTSDGQQASFDVQMRGRDNLVFAKSFTIKSQQVFSVAPGKVSFFDPGAAVSDDADGIVFSGQARELYDKYTPDLALVHWKGDGTLGWAKTWSEPYHQKVPEPNNETGGSADQISNGGDGYIYYGASRSTDNYNAEPASFQALVYKVKISDGSIAWAKGLRNGTQDQAWRGFMGYTVDASLPDRVLVGGYTDSNKWGFAALSKTDGSVLYSRTLDVKPGAAGKIYTIRVAADGTGYFGGDADGRAVIARVTGLDTAEPTLDWAAYTGGGIGTRVESIDLAADGSLLAALHIGGATREFAAARIKSDGSLAWAKSWGTPSGLNNARVIRRKGNTVYVGGKVSAAAADTSSGDGLLLALDVETGAYKTGGMFYGGKTTTTLASHLLKGIIFQGDDVLTMIDGYPGINNAAHYWGLWYQPPTEKLDLPLNGDGSERLVDYGGLGAGPTKVPGLALKRFPKASSTEGDPGLEVTAYAIDTSTIWKDIAPADASLYDARTYEHGPVGHFNIQRLTITE